MAKITYTKYILPTEVENYGVMNEFDDRFKTIDYVYVESSDEVEDAGANKAFYRTSPSDYCIANGALQSIMIDEPTEKAAGQWWLRTPHSAHMVEKFNGYGYIMAADVAEKDIMLCPNIRLDAKIVDKQRQLLGDMFKIETVKDAKGKVAYHTIVFGEFPQSYVGKYLNAQLEICYRTGQLHPTGKKYTARMDDAGKIHFAQEYEFKGKKYVRIKNYQPAKSEFKDGTPVKHGKFTWFEVEPIKWKIVNWGDMQKSINPNGNDNAKAINVRSEQGLVVLPFYSNEVDRNSRYWQNSTPRGYLNGINVNNIAHNDKNGYSAQAGGDFSGGQNFLQEAEIGLIITMAQRRTSQPTKGQKTQERLNSGLATKLMGSYLEDLNSMGKN